MNGLVNLFDDQTDPLTEKRVLSHRRPRAAIYEVKAVKHSGMLFIKARGYSFLECRPHRDAKVVEWIATRLNEGLGVQQES